MDPQITAALIAVAASGIGGLATRILPQAAWFERLISKHGKHSLVGDWSAEWGPLPVGPATTKVFVHVTRHSGSSVRGYMRREQDPKDHWRWYVEARYDGRFLQGIYFPGPTTEDLTYGTFFLERTTGGYFVGTSTGHRGSNFGSITTDYLALHRA